MTIITDVKLDFKDVMLQPKRSTLTSRSQVDLKRRYSFKHNTLSWEGTGIIAANMDHVGTMEMAREFYDYGLMVALHKHYAADELIMFFNTKCSDNTFYSMGIADDDMEKYNIVNKESNIKFVVIDVANGYSEGFLDFVKYFCDDNPDKVIMAGNVVTGDMTQELILGGVDIVKCGIGPGCFIPDTKILTLEGLKSIQDVKVGETVYTHTCSWRTVLNRFEFTHHKNLIEINENITCTPDHDFYVVHKNYLEIVNDDNLHKYATWVCAKDLDENWYILEENDNDV